MKKLAMIVAICFLGLSNPLLANCGNDNGNGNGCSDNDGSTGPQGPIGPAGPVGQSGKDGKDSTVPGAMGPAGKNGIDAQVDNSAKLVVDTAVRLYDSKYVQLQAFNTYMFARHDAHDVFEEFSNSRNFMFGARIVFKLGSSYEERLLDAQNRKIGALEAALSRLSQ